MQKIDEAQPRALCPPAPVAKLWAKRRPPAPARTPAAQSGAGVGFNSTLRVARITWRQGQGPVRLYLQLRPFFPS